MASGGVKANQAQELLRLKERIESKKTELARLQGQLEQLVEQRGRDFGVGSNEEAEAYLRELAAQNAKLSNDLEEGIQTIKEELGW